MSKYIFYVSSKYSLILKILQIKFSLIIIVTGKMDIAFIVLMAMYSNVTQNFDEDDIMEQGQYVYNRSGKIVFSISQNMKYIYIEIYLIFNDTWFLIFRKFSWWQTRKLRQKIYWVHIVELNCTSPYHKGKLIRHQLRYNHYPSRLWRRNFLRPCHLQFNKKRNLYK